MTNDQELETYIQSLQDRDGSSGMILGRYDRGMTNDWQYGTTRRQGPDPVDDHTLFAVGSLSKSFTCLSLMLLQEAGKLSIDDPIATYLPLQLDGKEEKITIRHLMSHSSGLPDLYICTILERQLGLRADYNQLEIETTIESWQDVFDHVMTNKEYPTSPPGTRFHYSDLGFSLLQYIIEQVSQQNYSLFLQEHIFEPLEMSDSTTRSTYTDQKAAAGHLTEKQSHTGIIEVAPNYPGHMLVDGGGGVMSSSHDLLNYLSMYLQQGRFGNRQLVSEEAIAEMITPQVSINHTAQIAYGLGWIIFTTAEGLLVFHTGNTGAVTTAFGFFPQDQQGYFLCNNITIPPTPIWFQLGDYLLDRSVQPYPDPTVATTLAAYTGSYQGPAGVEQLNIGQLHGTLYITQRAVGIYGVSKDSLPVLPQLDNQQQATGSYWIDRNGNKTRVIFETIENQHWVTVGIGKFKKIEDSSIND